MYRCQWAMSKMLFVCLFVCFCVCLRGVCGGGGGGVWGVCGVYQK